MSLKVWLPLNGNINNQGLLNYTPSASVTPTYVDGKIGKALNKGSITMPASITSQVLNNQSFSYCCWFYTTGSNKGIIFGNDSNRKFSLMQYPTANDLHYSWMNDSSTYFASGVVSGVLPSNKWTHIAVTYENPTGKVYINGSLVHTFTGTSASASFAYDTVLIYNNESHYMNDIRLYDHCLSDKEVKEISKGLVLHYPLGNPMETSLRNKINDTNASGYLYVEGGFTRTKLANERGYNYKFSMTGTGSNQWYNLRTSSFSFTAGKKYYYSCKIRVNKLTNCSVSLRASRSYNDWVTRMSTPSVTNGEWITISCYQTINSTYDRSGSTVTCSPQVEFYTSTLSTSGTTYAADIDIKDIQVVECDYDVPYIENTIASATVMDCSGYGNHGKYVGTVTPNPDTPRYEISYKMDTSSVLSGTTTARPKDALTLNVWVKKTDSTASDVIGNWEGGGGGFAYSSSGWGASMYINGSYRSITTSFTTLNAWTMLSLTYDGRYLKFYINGEYKGQNDLGSTYQITYHSTAPWCINGNPDGTGSSISSRSQGLFSDFRIYATALSANDIKQLYQTSSSIDKNGNLHCYEIKE